MRIGVIGTGAIGGTVAALLDKAGHEVIATARGEQLQAIRDNGLRLSGGFGDHLARPRAAEELPDAPELAVLSVKAPDARHALARNASALDGVPLLVIQNGLDGLRIAAEAAPASPLAGGLSLIAAQYLEPGRIRVTAPLPTVLGAPPGGDRAVAVRFGELLSPVLPVEVLPGDITGAQWTKLIVNHINALPAITGLSVQEVVSDSALRRVLTASIRESVRIAHRTGVRFARLSGLGDRMLGLVAHAPLALGGILPLRMVARMGPVPNYGSTLQSIRRGRPTEIDALNGAVVRVAAESGLDAPVNAAITELVHEVERTGRFLGREELLRRVRIPAP